MFGTLNALLVKCIVWAPRRFCSVVVPRNRVNIKFVKSSGPGGQNVNKVNTKVEVRFHLPSAEWLPEEARLKIPEKFPNCVNKEGECFVSSELTRYQAQNIEDCFRKLQDIIKISLVKPPPLSDEAKAKIRARAKRADRIRLREKVERRHTKNLRRNLYHPDN